MAADQDGGAASTNSHMGNANDFEESLNSIFQQIAENTAEPSSPIINRMHELIRSPRLKIVNRLCQLDMIKLNLLRKQLKSSNNDIIRENKLLKEKISMLERKLTTIENLMTQMPKPDVQPSHKPSHVEKAAAPAPDDQPPNHPLYAKVAATPTPDEPTATEKSNQQKKPQRTKQNDDEQQEKQTTNKKRNPVFGSKRPHKTNITGNTKPFSLFVGGFNTALELTDIQEFVEKDLHFKVLRIKSNKINKYNQSVCIDVDINDKLRALDPVNWYEGLIVKPYRLQRRSQSLNQQENDHNHIDQRRNNYHYLLDESDNFFVNDGRDHHHQYFNQNERQNGGYH